jgi:hypothetical protein
MRDFIRLCRQQRHRGLFVLLLVILVAAVLHLLLGNFSARLVPDSSGYLRVESWDQILEGKRTPFYGWLVMSLEPLIADYRALPWIQFFSLAAAMLLLYHAALRYGLSTPAALALTLPLPFGNAALLFMNYVHPEILAISLLLVALACALILASDRTHWGWYLTFAGALGLSYLMKPGFLLFIALLPTLVVFLGLHARSAPWGAIVKRAIVMGAIGVLPFMIYSSGRYVAVDHFHIVAFGGETGTGLTGQIMNEGTIEKLPEEFRQPALRFFDERERLEDEKIMLPLPISSTHGERVYWSAVLGYFDIFARNFDRVRSALFKELWEQGESRVQADRHAQAFSKAVKAAEPSNYALYIIGATTRFVGLLVTANATFVPAIILLMVVLVIRSLQGWQHFDTDKAGRAIVYNGVPILLIILVYVFASYVPSVAISFPARRYVDTAGILMAALPLYLAWVFWSSRGS